MVGVRFAAPMPEFQEATQNSEWKPLLQAIVTYKWIFSKFNFMVNFLRNVIRVICLLNVPVICDSESSLNF